MGKSKMEQKYVSHIQTPDSLILMFDMGAPRTVKKSQKAYKQILGLIEKRKFSEIPALSSTAGQIEHGSRGLVKIVNGKAMIEGDEVPKALSRRLVNLANSKAPMEIFVKFWKRLVKNPTQSSRESLFAFLEANHVPLTEDGCFMVYKRVDGNFMDCHTHKIDNSIGRTVTMARKDVDVDRNNTCSSGLHVAAYDYAAHQYGGARLLTVKVDPKDVVAVPSDYNNQKMRVCRYVVLNEYERTVEVKKEVVKAIVKKVEAMTLKATRGFVPIVKECVAMLEGDGRKPIYVVVTNARSRFLLITKDGSKKLDDLHYVEKFNRGKPVYATKNALAAAKIGGSKLYRATKTEAGVEIRPVKS